MKRKHIMNKINTNRATSLCHPKSCLWTAAVLIGLSSLATLSACNKPTTAAQASSNTPTPASMPASSTAAQNQPGVVPASLASLGEYGENIYDAAKAKQWTEAQAKLSALKGAIQQSSAELSKTEDKRTQLQGIVTSLDSSIAERQTAATMRESNQVTLVSSELAASYHPKVPADVARLDYDGRELEIWSRANDMAKLKTTAQDMRQTWDQLKPEVESHNGTAQAQKFGQLIAETDKAQTVAQYQKLAGPVLDEVDNLEKVFENFGH